MFDVSVNSTISESLLSLQTVFSCRMEIPGTEFSLKEEIMYLHEDIRTSASHHHNTARDQKEFRSLLLFNLLLRAVVATTTFLH